MMTSIVDYKLYSDGTDIGENNTAEVFSAIDIALQPLYNATVIDLPLYSHLILNLPNNLPCKLRLLPDVNLASRLSHLVQMHSDLVSNSEICGLFDYSLVSIEGSNPTIPFDCDLVLQNNQTETLVFIDYTASTSKTLIDSKKAILAANLDTHKLFRAAIGIQHVKSVDIPVSIENPLSSNEPGTMGLRIVDYLMSLKPAQYQEVLEKFTAVYLATNERLSLLESSSPPGDYKELQFSDQAASAALNVVSDQNDSESLKFLLQTTTIESSEFPYIKTLANLARKSQKFKKLVPIQGSAVYTRRDLQSNLAALESNWLCKALHAATLTDSVIAIDDSNNISFLSEFPCSKSDKVLPTILKYKACVKQRAGHVFKILFNPAYTDEKLNRVLLHNGVKKDKSFGYSDASSDNIVAEDFIRKAMLDYAEDYDTFTNISFNQPKDSIWRKILTISALSSNDLDNLGKSTCTLLENFLTMIEATYLGSCLSHFYEINKSILASLKTSPGDSEYYVGVNGSYKSVVIVKMSSTLDSFSKTNYSVIFEPERPSATRHTRLSGSYEKSVFQTKFYSIDPNQLSYNLKLPVTITSFATWEVENNLENGSIQNGKAPSIMFDSAIHALVNRDQFAQTAEQIRYFYMSAIGYGGSASSITEKVDFIQIKHSWEALYLFRSFKLAASLFIISNNRLLAKLEDESTKELAVCFPHTRFYSKSFSQTISSMYVCNIYNKFRAFHEVSEAICYNEILGELDIYKSRVSEDSNAVSGLSPMLTEKFNRSTTALMDYIRSPEFDECEISFNVTLAKIKSNRYSGSMTYMMGASNFHADTPKATIDGMFQKLSYCPIEACTMKGSMDIGESSASNQGMRAASAILEEIIRQYNLEPKQVNKSVLGAANLFDKMRVMPKTFSIFQLVLMQFCMITDYYRYRVIQKDQKGHRDISVLNFVFRIGSLFVETISRELSTVVGDTDVVHNPNKDKIVEDAIKAAFKESRTKKGAMCFDNSDQKRWGPNHNMNFFAYFMSPMLKAEPGIMRVIVKVFDKVFDKRAKFPETLIKLAMVKNKTSSASDPIDKFLKFAVPKMNDKIFETVLPQGMCQGIFHDTSSVSHAIKAKSSIHLASLVNNGITAKYFTTSDDAEGIVHFEPGLDMVEAAKVVHTTGLRVGNLFNMVRSNPKSAFNFHIAELNSIFYKKGNMATPSLKQRIAKLDVGFGVNHIEDFLTCLSASANYLSSGGSYMGTYIISILNLTMHTEQWLRWDFAKSEQYYKPVEMGGFPVIEPISTIISGGISNLYLRSEHLLSPENYSRLIVNTLLCTPERIALSEFVRSGSESARASYKTDDLTIFKGAGPFGLFQTVRTDRKLSVFERRHGISKWIIPEDFANINRSSPSGKDFLFTIFRNTSVNTLDTNLGVNSFHVRLAEPWVSYTRNCFVVSKASPFAPFLGGPQTRLSHKELKEKLISPDLAHASAELTIAFSRCIRHAEYEVLESQLTVRLTDAKSLFSFLREQEAESFKRAVVSPSIQTVTLRGQSASDADSYFLAIVKSMSGAKSKHLINKFRRSYTAYDSIDIKIPKVEASLLDTVVFADNAVSLYNKFIRRDTKMIIPNNVDDLRSLCLDILKNKYTERMGLIITGRLDLSAERSKPYAYSKWYSELQRLSAKRETSIVQVALAGKKMVTPDTQIATTSAVITKRDKFDISTTTEPSRTVLLSSSSKSGFISTVKTWASANCSFIMDRDTIFQLTRGRLTFSHDYYMGNNTFSRHPKAQYLEVKARSSVSTHFIETKVIKRGNRQITSYSHTFIFRDNMNGSKPTATITDGKKDEKWINLLADSINEISAIHANKWYTIVNPNNRALRDNKYRRTIDEEDKIRFVYITPATEFKLSTADDSLTLSLESKNFKLPIGYATAESVDSMKSTVTLTDTDFKKAVRVYDNVKRATVNFDRSVIKSNYLMHSFIDFVLVGSTIDTPDLVIIKQCDSVSVARLNSIQLDILRTMLVNNKSINVTYSAHRFTSSLLNMRKRRNHNHTFFSRHILGERAEMDSENISEASDSEDMLVLGNSEDRLVVDHDEDEPALIPEYLRDPSVASVNWADEMDRQEALAPAPVEESTATFDLPDDESDETEVRLDVQTRNEDHLFSDDDDTQVMANNEDEAAQPHVESNTNSPIPEVTLSSYETDLAEKAASDSINQMFKSLLGDSIPDDIFNLDETNNDDGAAPDDNVRDSIDGIFSKALNEMYGKIEDVKDNAMKSVITGHTVDGTLEHARPIIRYLHDWLNTAGTIKDNDYSESGSKNIVELTNTYLLIHSYGFLDSVNPLKMSIGSEMLRLPIELSAFAVINSMNL